MESWPQYPELRNNPENFHPFPWEAFLLTEVLDNRSDFKFLHFANVLHPPLLKVLYISNQA